MALPDTQIGLIRDESGKGHLKTLPIPEPGPNEVLIRNVAVASNPKDWKYPFWHNDYTYVEGNDIAGEIVKLGEGVVGLAIGERVAAFTKMATKQSKVRLFPLWSDTMFANTFAFGLVVWCIPAIQRFPFSYSHPSPG